MGIRALSLLLCTGEGSEVRLFLRKSRAGIGHSLYTRSENALEKILAVYDGTLWQRRRPLFT
jgi:hypothetical protein